MPSDSLVSIICRSTGRPELKHAIHSITLQTHSRLELVLVDASGQGLGVEPDSCTPARLNSISTGRALSRPVAANAGLQAANGELLMFLDEDDWIAPEHIAGLLTCLDAHPEIRAAYSSTQKTDHDGEKLDYLFNQEFDPVLLMRDNYIPIHAMLFHRQLLESGCQFDEDFPIYEDWDFWLQLSQNTDFIHCDQLTAFYREGGDSATAAAEARVRYDNSSELGMTRARLFDKWLGRFSGSRFNSLIGQLDQSATIEELSAAIDKEHAANLAHQKQIQQLLIELENSTHDLNIARNELENVRKELQSRIDELEASLNELHASNSWKMTGPYRVIGRKLKGLASGATRNNDKK